jgi:hypothetical protein
MAVRFRTFCPRVLIAAVTFIVLLAAQSLSSLALADEVDENRRTCDNLKADPDDRIPACTRLLESGRKDVDVGTIYGVRGNAWYLKGNFDNAL